MAFLVSDIFKRDTVESCPSTERVKSFFIRDILSREQAKITEETRNADAVPNNGVDDDGNSLLVTKATTIADCCTVDRRQPFNALTSTLFIPSHHHHHHQQQQQQLQQQQQPVGVPITPATFQQSQATYLLPASNGNKQVLFVLWLNGKS